MFLTYAACHATSHDASRHVTSHEASCDCWVRGTGTPRLRLVAVVVGGGADAGGGGDSVLLQVLLGRGCGF